MSEMIDDDDDDDDDDDNDESKLIEYFVKIFSQNL